MTSGEGLFFIPVLDDRSVRSFMSLGEALAYMKSLPAGTKSRFYNRETYKRLCSEDGYFDWCQYNDSLNKSVLAEIDTTAREQIVRKDKAWKDPSMPDCTKLNRAILANDLNQVKKLIDLNPKFLVNTETDLPTIIFHGAKTNAVYQAVKGNAVDVLTFLLSTLNSKQFWLRLYDDDSSYDARIKNYWGSLLNNFDKNCVMTPLYMGCVFGYLEVVKILLGYGEVVNRSLINKHGKDAKSVICDRASTEKEHLKLKINDLFDSVYVSLYIDNLTLQKVTTIVTPNDPLCVVGGERGLESDTKRIACLGPVLSSLVPTLITKWMSINKENLSDGYLLYEKNGLNLARELKVGYSQWFEFMRSYLDLDKRADLETLDSYLENRYEEKNFVDAVDFEKDKMNEAMDCIINQFEHKLVIDSPKSSSNLQFNFGPAGDSNRDETEIEDISDDEFLTPPGSPGKYLTSDSPPRIPTGKTIFQNTPSRGPEQVGLNDTDFLFLCGTCPSKDDYFVYDIVRDKIGENDLNYIKMFCLSCSKIPKARIVNLPPLNSPRHKVLTKDEGLTKKLFGRNSSDRRDNVMHSPLRTPTRTHTRTRLSLRNISTQENKL
uniref:ANK_REP_REGION domain-containing protein n=1 Tax=Rhabditophanes sp. KR3021 TaxID=114890 RepID=A0AC35UEZ5_9BILA